jgi:hypothetical protein
LGSAPTPGSVVGLPSVVRLTSVHVAPAFAERNRNFSLLPAERIEPGERYAHRQRRALE